MLRTFGRVLVPVVLALSIGLAACDSPSGPSNKPLSDEEILSVSPPEFDVLVTAYENVLREHPRISEDSNEFSRLLLDEVEELSASSSSVRASVSGTDLLRRLTSAEWLLIMKPGNWKKAIPMKSIAEAAHARAAAEFPAGTLEDGTGDAFRHAYWNVLMAKAFGVEWASAWATAHESETPAGGRKTMDLNNNEVGRNLFSAGPSLDNDALAGKIKAYPLVCMNSDAAQNSARLLYIIDCPTIRVFDDGPDFDDIFEVTLEGKTLGVTPAGGGTTFNTSGLTTGAHSLSVRCTLDGTHGGCGFEVVLDKGLTFPGGSTSTPQLSMDQGGTQTLSVIAPTLEGTLMQGLRAAPWKDTSSATGKRL